MNPSDTEIAVEIEQQVYSYLDLCAMYEKTPSINGFIDHMIESYSL